MPLPFASLLSSTAAALAERLPGGRHVWRSDGRAHIEVRGITDPDADELRARLHEVLDQLEGINWAEVNALTSRVVVDHDPHTVAVGGLLRLVRGAEAEEPGARPRRDAGPHPADAELGLRHAVTIAADAVGLWLALLGKLAGIVPIPIELGSLVSLIENQPRVRALIERRIGVANTDTLLGVWSALANGFAQGPLGLVVDIAHRAGQLSEISAHQRAWGSREPELYANPRPSPVEPAAVADRPVPLPDGPVEVWSNRISGAGAAAALATLVATRDVRRGADSLLAGMPKAARLGRDAFAAQVGRSLAARGIVVFDRDALRRLDRLDTVIIDAAALMCHTSHVTAVWATPKHDEEDVHRRAAALLDADDPQAVRKTGGWMLLPFTDVDDDQLPRGAKARMRELRRGGRTVLALLDGEELAGLAAVTPDIEPGAELLAQAARRSGLRLMIAGDRVGLAARLGADDTVARGGLADTIRVLQSEGAVVAVVARQARASLQAADVGIGLTRRRSGRPPWAADIICGRDLRDAVYVLDAASVAADVSRRSAYLALAGSSAGAMLAFTGPGRRAGHRVLAAVNGAAAAALVGGLWSGVRLARRPRPGLPDPTPWHALDTVEVLDRLDVGADGLTTEEAAHRLRARGGQRAERSTLEPFVEELANPLTPILGIGAGLSAMAGSTVDAAIVGSLIGINTLVGGVQRLHTERSVHALLRASSQEATVRRDGEEVLVPADEIVIGDVVVLVSGDAVPADCRILEAEGLEADESALTGESMPVPKDPEARPAATVAERSSMLYEGTTIAAGRATAIVVAAAEEATEAGSALAQIADAEPPTGGVEERLAELTRSILPVAGIAAAGVTGAGLLRGWAMQDVVGSAVNLAVASVPEGMPFLATGAQIAAARRLAERGAIVRAPRAMEALGRVDVLCFDKTGTLTEGRIAVESVSDGDKMEPLDGLSPRRRAVLGAALRASPEANGEPAEHATDEAVLAAGRQADVAPTEGFAGWERATELPFEPGRGLSAGLGRTTMGMRLSVKGAPETVLERCTTWRGPDATVEVDDAVRARVSGHVEALARQGHRVLAVAERDASDRSEVDEERVGNLELLGLLALADPVRSSAAEAVRSLRDAGVHIVMATGDHPSTAEAIAAELGILRDGLVVTGAMLESLGEEDLTGVLTEAAVFARVTPAQKVRIVQAYQRAGRTVAMTGDGANDAPSIRLADVGVALGQRATPAAREAADLVVTDDRIETIIDAVVEGRAMWSSVRDAISILVGGNLGEIGFTVGASLLSRRPPLSARQLLLVNLMTDLAPAMAIAVQPPAARDTDALLREGPDRSLGEALRRQIRVRAITTGGAATGAWAAARMTGTTGRASTVALLALVGAQLGQTLTAGKGNRLVSVTGLGSAAVLAGIVQTPGISHFFGCRPVGPIGWLQAGTASVLATGAAAVAAEPRPTEDDEDGGHAPSDGDHPIPAAHGEFTVVS